MQAPTRHSERSAFFGWCCYSLSCCVAQAYAPREQFAFQRRRKHSLVKPSVGIQAAGMNLRLYNAAPTGHSLAQSGHTGKLHGSYRKRGRRVRARGLTALSRSYIIYCRKANFTPYSASSLVRTVVAASNLARFSFSLPSIPPDDITRRTIRVSAGRLSRITGLFL